MKSMRCIIRVVAVFAATCALLPAAAQDYPTRTITLVVGYAPGGFTDLFGRLLADELTARLGQKVIVDNKPGAAGTIGGAFVAKAAPDGYTLLVGSPPHVISPLLQQQQGKAPYAPAADFRSTGLLGSTPSVLVASPSAPFNTLPELVAYAKANPGKLNYASGSVGASSHLSMELFKLEAGKLDIQHIPYKGSAPIATDLLGGRINMVIDNVLFYAPYIKDGRVKAIAAVSKQRSSLLPEVRTFSELGYSSIEAQAWYMVLTPAGTPTPIVNRLNRELIGAMRNPSIREKMAGAEFSSSTPDEGDALLRSELAKWSKVVREAGIKAE
jgi:tripartite-type tricarboxylate transporter receptor subunit TctC